MIFFPSRKSTDSQVCPLICYGGKNKTNKKHCSLLRQWWFLSLMWEYIVYFIYLFVWWLQRTIKPVIWPYGSTLLLTTAWSIDIGLVCHHMTTQFILVLVLQINGINYVLNVSTNCPRPAYVQEGHFHRIPIGDNYSEKILPFLPEAFQFLGKFNNFLLL